MAWLSPAYPVGAFAYSSGLEWAVEAGDVTSAEALHGWLATLLADGAGFCDAVMFAHAYRAAEAGDDIALAKVAELAAALAPSRERFLETTAQGRAFLNATRAAWPCAALDRLAMLSSGVLAYPVAVGVAAAGHGIPLGQALAAYLQALAANWVSAGSAPHSARPDRRATRRSPRLSTAIGAPRNARLPPLSMTSAARVFRADIASMRHETQYTRLFRS